MPTSAARLAPKTAAATSAASAITLPARALRTGTAVLPFPGSNAIRTPMPLVTGPADVSAAASSDGRLRPETGSATPSGPGAPSARRTVRQAAGTSTASGSSAMTAKPAASTATFTSMPGAGSASRAEPIGIRGEAAIATATATAAPATVTTASRAMARASRLPLVIPTARRIGNSAASSASCLASSWPRIASEISPASPANTASATACGLMARWVAATSSARLMVSIGCAAR